MILVHRLHGEALFINADLIETVEAAPDTIVTLVDGRTILVSEAPAEIVTAIAGFRASVIVAADELCTTTRPNLRVLSHREV
jgi:flagellar protein FlbD